MRYRDQPTVEVTERVQAGPEVVWALVTDIDLPARFSEELQSVEWLGGVEAVAVGNRFRGHNQNPALGEWSTECTVVEVEPGRRWCWTVNAGVDHMATWGFEVDPGREATTVRQWARMGPDRSGLSLAIDAMPDKEARIVARRLDDWRANMAANLAGIKALAEAASAAPSRPTP